MSCFIETIVAPSHAPRWPLWVVHMHMQSLNVATGDHRQRANESRAIAAGHCSSARSRLESGTSERQNAGEAGWKQRSWICFTISPL
jgi:hypothetical protein